MKKPIIRRYEIRTRRLSDLEDIEPILSYRFFTKNSALIECHHLNVQRVVFGATRFEYYVADRRKDV